MTGLGGCSCRTTVAENRMSMAVFRRRAEPEARLEIYTVSTSFPAAGRF